ncbi:hypothetical protein [Methylobacterium organophilum]|uniref:Uncharacterized protein n=1 Tax=Methylobacterium organophilum TaxID=410 RepID=A0ABQ4T9M8_METOR|nr:hypothetical protein [Methylobacterium organophilum]UMY16581.1 hypothetical protein MMB17_18095 [Methylobacterium organophilum]GJE27319.1 hypothetical protein LKMONMHP_2177 [Methylobacterium organophilum]
MNHLFAAAALLASLSASQALAETAPGPGPQPAADKRNNAAKIAGLAGFVNLSCPTLRTDTARLKSTVTAMGVSLEELEQGELRLRAQSYIEAYRKDVEASCKRAAELFGAEGRVVPGLFVAR